MATRKTKVEEEEGVSFESQLREDPPALASSGTASHAQKNGYANLEPQQQSQLCWAEFCQI